MFDGFENRSFLPAIVLLPFVSGCKWGWENNTAHIEDDGLVIPIIFIFGQRRAETPRKGGIAKTSSSKQGGHFDTLFIIYHRLLRSMHVLRPYLIYIQHR